MVLCANYACCDGLLNTACNLLVEDGPDAAAVAGDLFGAQEEASPPFGVPTRELAQRVSFRQQALCEGEADETDQRDGEQEQRPFAGRPLSGGQGHGEIHYGSAKRCHRYVRRFPYVRRNHPSLARCVRLSRWTAAQGA